MCFCSSQMGIRPTSTAGTCWLDFTGFWKHAADTCSNCELFVWSQGSVCLWCRYVLDYVFLIWFFNLKKMIFLYCSFSAKTLNFTFFFFLLDSFFFNNMTCAQVSCKSLFWPVRIQTTRCFTIRVLFCFDKKQPRYSVLFEMQTKKWWEVSFRISPGQTWSWNLQPYDKLNLTRGSATLLLSFSDQHRKLKVPLYKDQVWNLQVNCDSFLSTILCVAAPC